MLSIQNVPRSRVKKLLLIEIPHNASFFCLLKCDMTLRRSYRSARSLSCINGTPPFQGTRKLLKPTDINRNTSSRMQLRSFTISFMYHKHFKDLRESAEISSLTGKTQVNAYLVINVCVYDNCLTAQVFTWEGYLGRATSLHGVRTR